jgi:YHS domain-containing protein
VDVHVTETTPRTVYEGKTYYFCSQDCLKDFLKHPRRYLPKSG